MFNTKGLSFQSELSSPADLNSKKWRTRCSTILIINQTSVSQVFRKTTSFVLFDITKSIQIEVKPLRFIQT